MGLHHVGGLSWGWAAAASFVEIASMLGLAMLYRDLLRASGAHLSLTWILAASYTANALSIAVPVIGSGMGGRLAFQRFREGGVDAGAASLTLTVAGIVSSVTLASVLSVSAVLSGNPAAALSGVLAAALLVTAVALIAVALRTPKGTARLLGVIAFAVRELEAPCPPAEWRGACRRAGSVGSGGATSAGSDGLGSADPLGIGQLVGRCGLLDLCLLGLGHRWSLPRQDPPRVGRRSGRRHHQPNSSRHRCGGVHHGGSHGCCRGEGTLGDHRCAALSDHLAQGGGQSLGGRLQLSQASTTELRRPRLNRLVITLSRQDNRGTLPS